VDRVTVFLTVCANYACAEIVSLQLQTRSDQTAEAFLIPLPISRAISPNYIRKLAGKEFLSVEPMLLDKNRYSNYLTAGKTAYLQYSSYSILIFIFHGSFSRLEA
jgi:hypothetical protein